MQQLLRFVPKSVIGRLRLVIVAAYVATIAVASAIGLVVAPYSPAWGVLIAEVVALAAFYAVLPRLLRRLETTIRGVIATVGAVANGDLSQRVPQAGDDELSELARSINQLARSMGRSLKEIESAAQAVASSAHQILTATEEQQRVATQQSASLHETASTVEELDLSARQASENAQEVVGRTERASRQVLALSEKAQQVNKVSEVIDEVSRQIRILALNASIEGAENSGGFSVTASEIRRLADDTRKSTGEIDALVQDIQESTSSAVMIMEQTVESVKVIGLAMAQQSVATGQITEVMTEMNTGMRQTVESTNSTVQAGEELNRLAQSLQQTIERFRRPVDEPVGPSPDVEELGESLERTTGAVMRHS